MKYLLIAVAVFIVVFLMACCKVSGDESRREEREQQIFRHPAMDLKMKNKEE